MHCTTCITQRIASLLVWTAAVFWAGPLKAEPFLRFQDDLRGNFIVVGSSMVWDCTEDGDEMVAPLTGQVLRCPNGNEQAPDVFWAADVEDAENTQASDLVAASKAQTAAKLELPDGAVVRYARLYWAGYLAESTPDRDVVIQPGSDVNRRETVLAEGQFSELSRPQRVSNGSAGGDRFFYQASAEVTDLVRRVGSERYLVSGLDSSLDVPARRQGGGLAAWSIVVFYELPDGAEPKRNLTLFDGLDYVAPDNPPLEVQLQGFVVPEDAPFDATLGVVGYDGQRELAGDSIRFNGTELADPQNPQDNFFNASRTRFGAPVSVVGDLPQLSGQAGSYGNVDFDVVDVTDLIEPGATEATVTASARSLEGTGDDYLLGIFITSITTFKPVFTDSLKTASDVNGGKLVPGDDLEYTIVVQNTGGDLALQTVFRDPIPEGVTYVPGSLLIDGEAVTDATGDDVGEFDEGANVIVVYLGDNASAGVGGDLEVGDEVEVRFRVTVQEEAIGTIISNQGVVTAVGDQGVQITDPTDAKPDEDGEQPTEVTVDGCNTSADCSEQQPICDTTRDPQVCVECVTSADCNEPAVPDCNPDGVCFCPAGPGNCQDTDNDGVSDQTEIDQGTDPADADTDDDGALDGEEVRPGEDSDGDGLINGRDPDSDNDGLFDGTELGKACNHPDTDLSFHSCRVDRDPSTGTNAVRADTDGGGFIDGSEDTNFNGRLDDGEGDPQDPNDDSQIEDTDNDGLSDGFEETVHSNATDSDTDEDGVPDAQEANPSHDGDRDGLVSVTDPDSDDDGLFDGTESGRGCDDAATDTAQRHCRPDQDDTTRTSPVDPDSDAGGVRDGSEDANLNGRMDDGETDPQARQDDDDSVDTDADGLSDGLETFLGSDPADADSDDDGLPDGAENNPSDDTDGDGTVNVNDPDSDADTVFDGTERGRGCEGPGTDPRAMVCVADADGGRETTSAVNPDTDYGGIWDGQEDADQDGEIDTGETDPNDPSDDEGCRSDSDCTVPPSGVICEDNRCVPGCRGMGGNGCPEDQTCTSDSETRGQCLFVEAGRTRIGGGGFDCAVGLPRGRRAVGAALLLGTVLLLAVRRRRLSRGSGI